MRAISSTLARVLLDTVIKVDELVDHGRSCLIRVVVIVKIDHVLHIQNIFQSHIARYQVRHSTLGPATHACLPVYATLVSQQVLECLLSMQRYSQKEG